MAARVHVLAGTLAVTSVALCACSSSEDESPATDGGSDMMGGGGTSSGSGGMASSNGGTSSAGQSNGGASGGGDDKVLVGRFNVEIAEPTDSDPGGHTSVVGKIYDGPSPSPVIWEEALQEGPCTLFTPRVPFCEQPCGGSAACVEDDQCQPYPTAHSVGTVTMKGLRTDTGATEFSMDPVANGYQPVGVKLPYDSFSEGDTLSLEAEGGDYSPFSLEATGIAPLVVSDAPIQLAKDQGVTLQWTPPGTAGISRVYVKVDVSHHGGSKGMIECNTEDTGSLELSASMVTQLLDLGLAGFPTIVIRRQSIGSTTIEPGRVELFVSSAAEREVQIEGLISCNETSDCPSGQTCGTARKCE